MPKETGFDELQDRLLYYLSHGHDAVENIQTLLKRLCSGDQTVVQDLLDNLGLLGPTLGKIERTSLEIYRKSTTDSVTGLKTRKYLDEFVRKLEAMPDSPQCAYLMADIDHFGVYNKAYDHAQGDSALYVVSQTLDSTLQNLFPDHAVLVAKYGGEELGALVEGYYGGMEELRSIADGTRVAVMNANIPEHRGIKKPNDGRFDHVTVTIGYGIQEEAQPISLLMARVSEALVNAKDRDERNSVVPI
ncbi:GGDEF domain-containing protein [Candidatus Woesearchaeota archaeon]|nr:GGDEF domain-containing protein [Candidatus Woesearchaeota archaeon]